MHDLLPKYQLVFFFIAVVEVADEVGYGQKLVGVGQQQQRDGWENQGGGGEGYLHVLRIKAKDRGKPGASGMLLFLILHLDAEVLSFQTCLFNFSIKTFVLIENPMK